MTVQNLICFRLLTEYHSFLFLYFYFWLSNEEVSVSLRGIIHSYLIYLPSLLPPFFLCFRLLMEYHSFLFRLVILIVLVIILSFRLLMEYHSFLFLSINTFKTCNSEWFPSPYGVSFILIKEMKLHFMD